MHLCHIFLYPELEVQYVLSWPAHLIAKKCVILQPNYCSPNMQTDTPKGLTYRVWFWLTLLCNLRGGDPKRLKNSWIVINEDRSIEVNIPCEKNNAGGAKNPYNAGRHNYIPEINQIIILQ